MSRVARFAVSTPVLLLVEVASAGVLSSVAPIVWIGYLVLIVWTFLLTKKRRPDALPLTLSAIALYSSLSLMEVISGRDITALDFTAVYGLVLVLSVLVGVLVTDGTYVWAGVTALVAAAWSVAVGLMRGDGVEAVAIRAVIAVVALVLAAVLLSRLLDLLARAISLYDRSARLHTAVARCSEALLVETDAFAIDEAVRSLLEATEADYAFVDRTVDIDGEPGWEIVAQAGQGDFDHEGWHGGKYSAIPSLYKELSAGRAIVVHTRELEGEERALHERDGINSEVGVPITINGEFVGSVGFVDYREAREWDRHEIQTLWRAADMIGAYWRRQEDAAKLRESNEIKDRLLASVSHEIRTPLAAIVGLSEEIAAGGAGLGKEELRELNGIIAAQSCELAELVEDLLVASRADSGSLSVGRDPVDLARQVESVVSGVSRFSSTHKSIVADDGQATAWGDPLRVRQVVRNLVTNAIKYGGDEIVVSVGSSGEMARVGVADNGEGIPPEEVDLIFERYYRSSRAPSHAESMGIGLSLARQLAQLMGGTVEYVASNGWHSFVLSLPAVVQARDEARQIAATG